MREGVGASMAKKWPVMPARIERIEEVTDDLRIFWLRTQSPIKNFVPGQFCMMTPQEGIREKAYSIASLTDESRLIELFVELIPQENVLETSITPRLWKMNVGDTVFVREEAQGIFTLAEDVHNHIMVATVTGIAPYMSMLRERLIRPADPNHFFVFFGASYHNELAYHQELMEFAREYSERLTYIATVSRPHELRNIAWIAPSSPHRGVWLAVGRVNHVLARYLRGNETTFGFEVNRETSVLYACGNDGMVKDVRERFASRDLDPSLRWKFKKEIF